MQILCWGVRNMKNYQLSSVTSPSIEFEVSGKMISSDIIKNTRRNPNFTEPIYFFDVVSIQLHILSTEKINHSKCLNAKTLNLLFYVFNEHGSHLFYWFKSCSLSIFLYVFMWYYTILSVLLPRCYPRRSCTCLP